MDRAIIRTHDRLKFKKCRFEWDFSSKLRMNYEPVSVRYNLDFGTIMHKVYEVRYDPRTWHDPLVAEELARAAFWDAFREAINGYRKRANLPEGVELPEDIHKLFEEMRELGPGMVNHFFDWVRKYETSTPVYTEIEFEVPILVPEWLELPVGFRCARAGQFHDAVEGQLMYYASDRLGWIPVFYQGRIDLILKDKDGRYWLRDWKTAARLDDQTEFLERDEQVASYAWAILVMLGIQIFGVEYFQQYKGYPKPPKVLDRPRKGLILSTNKQQDTSYELMLEAIEEQGETPEMYQEYLDYLKNEGKKWVNRVQVFKSRRNLDRLGERICLEAVDMLDDPYIYAAPDKWKCKFCDFRGPCDARMDGGDELFLLNQMYVRRDDGRLVKSNRGSPGAKRSDNGSDASSGETDQEGDRRTTDFPSI